MNKYMKNQSFKNKIYQAFMFAFSITVIFSCIIIFGITLPSLHESTIKYEGELIHQTGQRIDEYLIQVNSLAIQVSYSERSRSLLEKKYDGSLTKQVEYVSDLSSSSLLYQDFLRSFKGIDGIFIFNSNGYPYYYTITDRINRSFDVQKEDWYTLLSSSTDYKQVIFTDVRVPPQLDERSNYYVSLLRNIRSLSDHAIIGQVETLIRPSSFGRFLTSTGNTSYGRNMTLVDSSGNVICSTKNYTPAQPYDQAIFSRYLNSSNKRYQENFLSTLTTCYYSEYSGWYLIGETNYSVILHEMASILLAFLGFLLIAFSTMAILGKVIAKQMTQPVKLLMDGVSHVKNAQFNVPIQLNSPDEFGQLADSFNSMSQKLEEYFQHICNIEEQKRETEIIALQAQINPHFTLNTINTIKHLALLQNSTNIATMLEDCSLLLSAAFRFPNELITIQEELDRIRAFIRIEKISSFGKIQILLDYDDNVLDCLTMGLILQPLVENAIFHGIKPKMSSHQIQTGKISISIQLDNDFLVIHVKDDGVGMLDTDIATYLSTDSSGIGLKNVNTRIKLRFGEEYGLSISSVFNEGCDVRILLPRLMKAQNHLIDS